MEFPIRINKYLKEKGISTRKDADVLIQSGHVKINGKTAVLGQQVQAKDIVEVKSQPKKTYRYVVFNKPKGIVSHSPQSFEQGVQDIITDKSLFPLGRLDKDSEGLLILTNDNRVTDRLLNPKFEHEKEYIVSVREKVRNTLPTIFGRGVNIILEDRKKYLTKPAKVELLDDHTFKIVLTEGKKHQIRRMCDNVHMTITSLKRTRVANIRLGKARPGTIRDFTAKEREVFLKNLNLE